MKRLCGSSPPGGACSRASTPRSPCGASCGRADSCGDPTRRDDDKRRSWPVGVSNDRGRRRSTVVASAPIARRPSHKNAKPTKRHVELVAEAAVTRTTVVHGHEVAYRAAGDGPVLVLVHGIAGSSNTWSPMMPLLAEDYTVIAPDLLGHGESAKPRGDYSLGAYASGIRDLLMALGHERATFVGHSLGGGIAMQFAYQFPHMCERLALVASGGFGQEVHLLLRASVLPGSELVLPLLTAHGVVNVTNAIAG